MIAVILLFLFLIISFYTDYKHRTLPIWLLVAISVLTFIWSYNKQQFLYVHEYIINIVFLFFLLFGMIGFWRIKRQPISTFFSSAFGLADVWIMVLWAFTLPPNWFLLNIVVGSISALLLTAILRWKTVPLAGIWCLCFGMFIIVNQLNIL
ncbi:MAG: prepilin peptidase [Bacteroidales bacterium]|nr:prepilin peptidase [Bacteroidales bacterium]